MLLISDETLDLIAGGFGITALTDSISIPSVTIIGTPPPDEGSDIGGYWPPIRGGHDDGTVSGSGSAGGGGSQPAPPHDCTGIHASPPPEVVPNDIDLNGLRNMMTALGESIKQFDGNTEHGALVVRDANGDLRAGEISHGTGDTVMLSIDLQPGDVVVAYIHSHPYNGIDQKTPSNYDIDQLAALKSQSQVDPGVLLYILDNQSGDVYEYPSTVQPNPRVGNNVSDDLVPTC